MRRRDRIRRFSAVMTLSWIKRNFADRQKTSPAVRASVFFALGGILQKGVSVICVPVFTRLLTAEDYGLYNLYCSWITVFSAVATLELTGSVLFCGLQKYRERQEEFLSAVTSLMLVGFVLSLAGYLIFADMIDAVTGLDRSLTLLMFLEIFGSSQITVWSMGERFSYRYRKALAVTVLTAVLSPALGAFTVYFSGLGTYGRILVNSVLLSALGGVFAIFILLNGKKLFDAGIWRFAVIFTLPLIPHYLSQSALRTADRIIMEKSLGLESVAYYSVAYSVGMLASVIAGSINSSLHPWVIREEAQGQYRRIRKIFLSSLLLVATASLGVVFLSPEALRIFAPGAYSAALYAIPPVAASVYFIFINQFLSNAEFSCGKTWFSTVASVSGALLNITANILLLPRFGFVCAGYTTLFSYAATAVIHFLYLRLRLKRGVIPGRASAAVSLVFLLLCALGSLLYPLPYLRYFSIVLMIMFAVRKRRFLRSAYQAI